VVRFLFVVNLPNYRPADQQFNNLVRKIAEEVVKSLRSCVGSVAPGGGFEPPTTGLTAFQQAMEEGKKDCLVVSADLLKAFMKWVKEQNPSMSERMLYDYANYSRKLLNAKVCSPEDAFNAMGGLNKRSYEVFRRLLTFLEKSGYEAIANMLKRSMPKKPGGGVDTFVPSDSDIQHVREAMARLGAPFTIFYNVLVSSGCRATEAYALLTRISKLRVVDLGGYVRVHLDLQRGSKNAFALYLPKEVLDSVRNYRGPLPKLDAIGEAFRDAGLGVKYFRKWWRTKLKLLGIDGETIEAFQGRASSIGARHYTDWIPVLDATYARVLPELRRFLAP